MNQKESIILVDKDDTIIGHIDRSERKPTDIYRVSCLWVTNSQGDILLAQRHKSKASNPEKWGPAVAGTNDEGETYESNIYKEAKEEIDLTGVEFQKEMKIDRTEGNYPYWAQWFSCIVDRDISTFHMQEDEVQDIRWWKKEDLRKALTETPEIFTKSMPRYFEMFDQK